MKYLIASLYIVSLGYLGVAQAYVLYLEEKASDQQLVNNIYKLKLIAGKVPRSIEIEKTNEEKK